MNTTKLVSCFEKFAEIDNKNYRKLRKNNITSSTSTHVQSICEVSGISVENWGSVYYTKIVSCFVSFAKN